MRISVKIHEDMWHVRKYAQTASMWGRGECMSMPQLPTYYVPLADLLHTTGRLITRLFATRCDTFQRRCGDPVCPWHYPDMAETFRAPRVSYPAPARRSGRLITCALASVPKRWQVRASWVGGWEVVNQALVAPDVERTQPDLT